MTYDPDWHKNYWPEMDRELQIVRDKQKAQDQRIMAKQRRRLFLSFAFLISTIVLLLVIRSLV